MRLCNMLNSKILRTEVTVLHISALQIIFYSHNLQGFLITLTFGLFTVKSKTQVLHLQLLSSGFYLSMKIRSLFSCDLAVASAIWNCDGGCIYTHLHCTNSAAQRPRGIHRRSATRRSSEKSAKSCMISLCLFHAYSLSFINHYAMQHWWAGTISDSFCQALTIRSLHEISIIS